MKGTAAAPGLLTAPFAPRRSWDRPSPSFQPRTQLPTLVGHLGPWSSVLPCQAAQRQSWKMTNELWLSAAAGRSAPGCCLTTAPAARWAPVLQDSSTQLAPKPPRAPSLFQLPVHSQILSPPAPSRRGTTKHLTHTSRCLGWPQPHELPQCHSWCSPPSLSRLLPRCHEGLLLSGRWKAKIQGHLSTPHTPFMGNKVIFPVAEEGRPDSSSASPAGSTPLGFSRSRCAPEGPTCPHPQICLTAALGTAVGTWVLLATHLTHMHTPLQKTGTGDSTSFRSFPWHVPILPGWSYPGGINIPEQFLWNPKITHMSKIQHMLQHC